MQEPAKPISSLYPAVLVLVGERQTGGRGWRVQLQGPMRPMGVVVVQVHPEHLLQVPATHDEQPVQAFGADGPHPTLRIGVGVGRLHGYHQHLGARRAEHVVEPTAELRITVADKELQSASLVLQCEQQVAGLLGDPGGVGIGSHPGQVDAPGVEFDEEQDVEPSQPEGVDR